MWKFENKQRRVRGKILLVLLKLHQLDDSPYLKVKADSKGISYAKRFKVCKFRNKQNIGVHWFSESLFFSHRFYTQLIAHQNSKISFILLTFENVHTPKTDNIPSLLKHLTDIF